MKITLNTDGKMLALVAPFKRTTSHKAKRLIKGRAMRLCAQSYSGDNYVAIMQEWCALAGTSYY